MSPQPEHAAPPTAAGNPPSSGADSFPRQFARTRGFRLGAPRGFHVSPDGDRVFFLRSMAGDDAVNRLWCLDVGTGVERLVADPVTLLGGDTDDDVPAAERARRERLRETTAGITAYATDRAATRVAFALAGRLFVLDVGATDDDHTSAGVDRAPRELSVAGPVVDPRLSPDGSAVAYVTDRALVVADTSDGRELAALRPESPTVAYGAADFVAAEEFDRVSGFWWSPTGEALLVERFDEGPVAKWWIADPADPARQPVEHRYPAAGEDNASVSLRLLRLDAEGVDVEWDHEAFPYLASVRWPATGRPLVVVLSRDQRRMRTLAVDPVSGSTSVVRDDDDFQWVEVVTGVPSWSGDGRLVHTTDDPFCDTRRLAVDGRPVGPAGWQVRHVVDVGPDRAVVVGGPEPTEQHVAVVAYDGGLETLTRDPGVHSAAVGGPTTVLLSTDLDRTTTEVTVHRGDTVHRIGSAAEACVITPHVTLLRAGVRALRTAVLFPSGHVPGSRRLPVLMSPYGGPHHLEVVAAGARFAEDQWFADQGFVVVVSDGRGTPGRGPAWEREIHHDFGLTLDDQVEALAAVAERFPDDVDTGRVGIRGWSFGGWLAAAAVLRRPDVFHAGVAGAPVTDWRRYDTAYTERYLGHPAEQPAVYDENSLLLDARWLSRPLLLVHGLADDNVVAAHTLALSAALLAAGKPHSVLPLTGVTHMTPQEVVAENLLRLQVGFLREHLGAVAG